MGLFSFLKNMGSKNLENKAAANDAANAANKAAEARSFRISSLKDILGSTGIPVNNLDVDLDGDTVVVYGQTTSVEDKDRLLMVLGNMDGVNSVDDRISVVVPEVKEEIYEVVSGDSLSKIAKKFYGDPMKYKDIFEANRDILEDPNKIFPGQNLRIPR